MCDNRYIAIFLDFIQVPCKDICHDRNEQAKHKASPHSNLSLVSQDQAADSRQGPKYGVRKGQTVVLFVGTE